MNCVNCIYENVKYYYKSMNSATLSGAIDVIVVKQPDGSLRSTPFHVRFGKYSVFIFENKLVDIEINGEEIDLKMKLSESGVAYFLESIENGGNNSNQEEQLLNCKQSLNFSEFVTNEGEQHDDSDGEQKQTDSPLKNHWLGRVTRRFFSAATVGGNREDKENEQIYGMDKAQKNDAIRFRKGTTTSDHFLCLSNEQLQKLNLNCGSNDARFRIRTKFQGTAWCSCHIYLLQWTDKLVISDVDGTITKSDVLGHLIPAIGGTWVHPGVTELYTRIKMNGYQMVYLSSRAIGQSRYTKTYLKNIAQGSQSLPDGPMLLSPISVLMAFKKEVIDRRPEDFKIACLNDLKSLFPTEQPFFAGFGNRETDVKTYRTVGIPLEKIMIIDPRGRLRRADNRDGVVSDYATMATSNVDSVFPPRFSQAPEQSSESPPHIATPTHMTLWKTNKLQQK